MRRPKRRVFDAMRFRVDFPDRAKLLDDETEGVSDGEGDNARGGSCGRSFVRMRSSSKSCWRASSDGEGRTIEVADVDRFFCRTGAVIEGNRW